MSSPLLRLPGILILGALVFSLPLPTKHVSANYVSPEVNEGELLQKYISLSGQAGPEKIRSMQALSPTERGYVWRVQLGMFMARHPTLTREQQSIVFETFQLTTNRWSRTAAPNNSSWRSQVSEPIKDLKQRGQQIFSRDQIAEIFGEIGVTQDLDLLERYAEFSQFTKADRKTRFNQISAQEKSDLWRVHLGLNLARHLEWTDQQRSIVLEAISIASPTLYQIRKDRNWMRLVDEPMQLFAQRALLVFSEEEAADLFAELGAKEPQAHHARLTTYTNCSCSTSSNWCSQSCESTDCIILTWGCGTFGLYACDAKCSSTRRV